MVFLLGAQRCREVPIRQRDLLDLGDSNALYFQAGPEEEKDGLFGSLCVQ
ncbi:hypothetical protein ACWF9G_06875 [Nocardia sp. NPDC055029]